MAAVGDIVLCNSYVSKREVEKNSHCKTTPVYYKTKRFKLRGL